MRAPRAARSRKTLRQTEITCALATHFQCVVCYRRRDLGMFVCGHIACAQCVSNHVRAAATSAMQSAPCPLCRMPRASKSFGLLDASVSRALPQECPTCGDLFEAADMQVHAIRCPRAMATSCMCGYKLTQPLEKSLVKHQASRACPLVIRIRRHTPPKPLPMDEPVGDKDIDATVQVAARKTFRCYICDKGGMGLYGWTRNTSTGPNSNIGHFTWVLICSHCVVAISGPEAADNPARAFARVGRVQTRGTVPAMICVPHAVADITGLKPAPLDATTINATASHSTVARAVALFGNVLHQQTYFTDTEACGIVETIDSPHL